jgi:hypothetical protein
MHLYKFHSNVSIDFMSTGLHHHHEGRGGHSASSTPTSSSSALNVRMDGILDSSKLGLLSGGSASQKHQCGGSV